MARNRALFQVLIFLTVEAVVYILCAVFDADYVVVHIFSGLLVSVKVNFLKSRDLFSSRIQCLICAGTRSGRNYKLRLIFGAK